MGGLHIETEALKTLKTRLGGSSWADALTLPEITSDRKAEAGLQATHVTSTHLSSSHCCSSVPVTVASLPKLQESHKD